MRALLVALAVALFAPSAHACAMLVWEEEEAVPLEQLLVQIDEAVQPSVPEVPVVADAVEPEPTPVEAPVEDEAPPAAEPAPQT